MGLHYKSYRCHVCPWRGQLEPFDFADSAPCPNCGSYLYPESFWSTWGLALGILLGTAGLLFAIIRLMG